LVAGDLPKDNQFPNIEQDLPDAAKYASLWATNDVKQIHDIKFFWVLMEASIQMWINRRSCLSPTVHNTLQSFADFKADMHNIYIRVRKDLAKQWSARVCWGPSWHHCRSYKCEPLRKVPCLATSQ